MVRTYVRETLPPIDGHWFHYRDLLNENGLREMNKSTVKMVLIAVAVVYASNRVSSVQRLIG